MLTNIVINALVPVLYAYGVYYQMQSYKDRALHWLNDMNAEKNNITLGWKKLGINSGEAGTSQSLIELKTQYCNNKKCLECAIGNALLKRTL